LTTERQPTTPLPPTASQKTPVRKIGASATIGRQVLEPHLHGRLKLLPLVAVMYLTISGGAYGLEDAVRTAGARLTLILCLLVPLTLSLPTALMAAELTALTPKEGGFYVWVKDALGPFAGFAEAYLTMLYTAVDMAIYPVMFISYASFLAHISPRNEMYLAILMVWAAGFLNLMGVRPVGNASVALAVFVLAPLAAMVIAGVPRLIEWRVPAPAPYDGHGILPALGAGLTVVIWNFSGWENLSVVAEEIQSARKNYLRAVVVVLPMVALGYLLPLAVGLSGATDTSQWRTGWFAEIGRQIGGSYLGWALALGGLLSAFSIFEAGMLWVSRMPFVLAREGYLPRALADLSRSTETPARAIVVCCIVFTVLVPLGFTALVVMDVFFYMAALALEMIALVRLRRLSPDRSGMYKIAGGPIVLYAVAIAPLMTWLATFGTAWSKNGSSEFLVAAAIAALAWPVYWVCRRQYGGPGAR
jgi:amino acid transporter